MNCGVIFHKSCRVRNPADQPGFRCYNCPTDVGVLVDVPDRITGKPVSSAKKAAPKLPQAKTKPSYKITKAAPVPKKGKLRRELNGLGRRENPLDIENVQQEASLETSPKRRSLRQKPALGEKIEPTRKRKPRKSASKYTEEEIKSQYDAIFQGLMRKAKEGREDTRSSDLHEIFLRNSPIDALWASYCVTPDGRAANPAVRKATEVHFVNYHVEPVNTVPETWSTEVGYRLRLLLNAAVSDGQTVRLSTKLWEKDIGMALRHLQDLAKETLHRGSYKGKRGRLGLLAEVLGLSEKGTFWKGGDRFAVSAGGAQERSD